jgi:microcystin-dependent protein
MDICASNWNEDDASNITAAPDGAPEGMAPSGVNNVLRAHQGAIKRAYNWSIPKQTGSAATAYTLSYAVAPGALVDGMTHVVEFHVANGTASTLNVNLLGAIPIHYYSAGAWRVLPPGLLGANEICRVAYHGNSGAYRLIGRPDTTGDWVPTGRATARAGTILAYGQAVSRTEYAGLFAAYSTTYGPGDGSTTFNLPDLRGRTVAGKSNMGGSDAANLAGGSTLGAALGSQQHTHSLSVSVSVSGSCSVSGTTDGPNLGGFGAVGGGFQVTPHPHGHNFSGSGSFTGGGTGSGSAAADSSVQPTRIANYAICL